MTAVHVLRPRHHLVHLFEREGELVGTVGRYVAAALRAEEVAVVVATRRHVRAIRSELADGGVDATLRSGRLITIDAEAALERIASGDVLDEGRFEEVVGKVVRNAGSLGAPVSVFGEIVDLLWQQGNVAGAIELERMWDRLGRVIPFALLCAYRIDAGPSSDFLDDLRDVCACHTAVVDRDLVPVRTHDAGTAPRASRSFVATRHAPRLARRFVAEVLTGWGWDQHLDDAALVVSELATNAVLHARSGFGVAVVPAAGGVRISVRDAEPRPPVLGGPPASDPSGRGLAVVAAVSRRWGCDEVDGGKIVWAELHGPGTAGDPPGADPPVATR